MAADASPIGGGEVALRPAEEGDLALLFEFQREPEGVWMAAFTSKDPSDRAAYFAKWKRLLTDPTIVARAVLCDGRVVGSVAKYEDGGAPEVTYCIGREFWGRGLATRALAALLRELPMRPLRARVAKDNVGSIRVLEKCGFTVQSEEKGYAHGRGREVEEFVMVLAQ